MHRADSWPMLEVVMAGVTTARAALMVLVWAVHKAMHSVVWSWSDQWLPVLQYKKSERPSIQLS
ncbi:hypothetical protein E2C01_035887 [Portunus trituberculatus]|uniref:Uncharacterized protein n=1 Tax=Portunus trituberculatus TaxID=210409 RepID=A0A5B7F4C5_PORTR|nr:hypothetical protein [Portunus trituberculatus]